MNYQFRNGWRVSFLESDCRTSLPLNLTFTTEDKVREMFTRFGAGRLLEDEQGLEHGISIGRGGVWLSLTEEQYQRLKLGRR